MKTVLFQGDSITDVGRSRSNDGERGQGYPTLVAARLGYEYPGEYNFINRGNSGDRVPDILARIKKDIINLAPDYLSVLIGINDVWHEISADNGTDEAKYFRLYCEIIEEVKRMCPGIEIFILEPFVLKGSATENNWGIFKSETALRAARAREVAEKYSLHFIELQSTFDALCEKAQPSYWLKDGVHPTAAGHEVIAMALSSALKEQFNK